VAQIKVQNYEVKSLIFEIVRAGINRTVIVAMLLKLGDIMATKMAWGVNWDFYEYWELVMIAIIEIQYQMKQGATAPYLCLADNNKKYVIKRQRAGFDGCI
jgi:hypothetical protein